MPPADTPVRTFTSTPLEPYERGREFGRAHSAEVALTVSRYRQLFAVRAVEPFDFAAWSARAWAAIREHAPVAAEEIRGIADGAGLPPAEVAALNARTELLAVVDPTLDTECSVAVALPEGRPPVAVQTWDWYTAMSDGWLCWRIPFPDGRVVETVTEYGVLAKIGVNGNGVGVLFTLLHHESDRVGEIGYPVHLLSRKVLEEAADLDAAVRIAGGETTSASTSLTIVEGREDGGRAVSVELFPGGPGLLPPAGRTLVRTNHFLSEEGRDGCLLPATMPSSRIRRAALADAFATMAPPTGADEVVEAMRHHDALGGVCSHPLAAEEPLLQHGTLATVSLDTVGHRLQVWAGGPCGANDQPLRA